MGSSRFPGKPLEKILGKPMIGHVYDNVSKSKLLSLVAVATCDVEIYDYIRGIGGISVMTSNTHERASDRCAEALLKLEEVNGVKYDIVVMVQGDEPMTNVEMIDEAVSPMILDAEIKVVNLLGSIKDKDEFEDRNCIKVVCDLAGNAIYFSRQPIPTSTAGDFSVGSKQVCVIPFRRNDLLHYTKLKPTPLEIAESIDMMRLVENGIKVKMIPTKHKSQSVDTIEDLLKIEKIMKKMCEL
jgi:3-deoxy-manno-octulosonate cytidylyltransferase (CMP-KDO synthetase)